MPIRNFTEVHAAQKRKLPFPWCVPFLPNTSPSAWIVEVENENFKRDLLKCADLLYIMAFARKPSAPSDIL